MNGLLLSCIACRAVYAYPADSTPVEIVCRSCGTMSRPNVVSLTLFDKDSTYVRAAIQPIMPERD